MEEKLEQIRDAQKASWDKFSPGWKKWDDLTMEFIRPHGDEMLRQLDLKGDEDILDIASGTGEPGITIANNLPNGKIILTDLSEGMLDIAIEKAKTNKIDNIEAQIVDACNMPFEDNTFDAISCRLGFMFFPDMQLAANEMVRVLKPGGKLVTTVWGKPESNFWVTCMVKAINSHIDMPLPPEGAPGMFRCAPQGIISNLFQASRMKNISEAEIAGKINCESPTQYWDFMTEIAAPFVAALSDASSDTIEKIKQEVINSIKDKNPNETALDTLGIIIYAEK